MEHLTPFTTAFDKAAQQPMEGMDETGRLINQIGISMVKGWWGMMPLNPRKIEKFIRKGLEIRNKSILDKLGAKDNEDRVGLAKPLSNQIRQNFRQ